MSPFSVSETLEQGLAILGGERRKGQGDLAGDDLDGGELYGQAVMEVGDVEGDDQDGIGGLIVQGR